MKRFLTGMLCAGILTSQPAVTYAAETSATPEAGHSETYSQASKDGPQVLISRDSPQC